MLPHFSPRSCLLPVALLVALAGCSGEDGARPAGVPTGTQPTTTASSAAASASPPAAAPSPSPSASASAVERTSSQLKGALLALKDLPAGFEVDKSSGDDGTTMSSRKGSCSSLVRLMNSAKPAGSRAQAQRSFSGGQDGPFVDESLDAMGTPQAARAFVEKYRAAVKACSTVRVSIPGVGSSNVAVREISFGKIGDDTFAARFRAKGGPLDGLEIIQAGVQSGDILVGVTAVGLDGPDAEAATEDAVKKASQKLGTSGPI